MKRLFAIVLVMLLVLSGCARTNKTTKIKGDECDFLINGNWEGNDTQCVNVISFKENGSFSNWCYCGSPVGDGDLAESYSYHDDTGTVKLYDSDGKVFEEATIIYADDAYLVIDIWGRAYVYENLNAYRPQVAASASETVGLEEMTKPCLSIIGFDGELLAVSNHNYDRDAASSFDVWQLSASDNLSIISVEVTNVNGEEKAEKTEIAIADFKENFDGHYLAYLEIDREGKVEKIICYSELIVQ